MPVYDQTTAKLVREDSGEEVTPGTWWETHHHGKPIKGKNGAAYEDRWEFRFVSRLPEFGKSGKIVSTRPCKHKDGDHPHYCNGTDTHEGYPPHGMKIVIADRFNGHTMAAIHGVLFLESRKDDHLLELAQDKDYTSKQFKITNDYLAARFTGETNPSWITSAAATVAYRRGLIDAEEFAQLTA